MIDFGIQVAAARVQNGHADSPQVLSMQQFVRSGGPAMLFNLRLIFDPPEGSLSQSDGRRAEIELGCIYFGNLPKAAI